MAVAAKPSRRAGVLILGAAAVWALVQVAAISLWSDRPVPTPQEVEAQLIADAQAGVPFQLRVPSYVPPRLQLTRSDSGGFSPVAELVYSGEGGGLLITQTQDELIADDVTVFGTPHGEVVIGETTWMRATIGDDSQGLTTRFSDGVYVAICCKGAAIIRHRPAGRQLFRVWNTRVKSTRSALMWRAGLSVIASGGSWAAARMRSS